MDHARVALVLAASIALVGGPASASEAHAANPNFRDVAWLVGEWTADFAIPGSDLRPTMTWSWGGPTRDYLWHRGTRPGPDGTLVPEYDSVVAWHPTRQELVLLAVYLGDGGEIFEDGHVEIIDDGGVRLHMNVHYPEGARLPFSGDDAVAGPGGHTLRFRRTLRPEGDGRLRGHFVIQRGGRWEIANHDMPEAADGFVWVRKEAAAAVATPDAVVDLWARMIGTWIADNSAYKTGDDALDAFGLEWSWGLGEKALLGRLYGIKDGKDVGTFWEFREFWHPGERRVITTQYGRDGTYGVGTHRIAPDGSSEMLQTFYDPTSGAVSGIGHRSRLEGDEHTTESFDVSDEGEWIPRRTYVWHRQKR